MPGVCISTRSYLNPMNNPPPYTHIFVTVVTNINIVTDMTPCKGITTVIIVRNHGGQSSQTFGNLEQLKNESNYNNE